MVEFAYNNAKNTSTGHISFELNFSYHPRDSFEEDIDPHSKSRSANKLAEELRKLMKICYQNLFCCYKKKPMTKKQRAIATLWARRSG